MNDYPRQPTDHDCAPTKDPAPQPHEPSDDCDKAPQCCPRPKPWPYAPKPCPDPETEPRCKCPPKPTGHGDCLQDLIDEQTKQVTAADKAKAIKVELEAFQTKVKQAEQEYTREKYEKLLKEWGEQDAAIVRLIGKLVCTVPCWECVIECYVCPWLDQLHEAEQYLYGDGGCCDEVHNLYDERYWLERDLDCKKRIFQRIKDVLTAWQTPGQTIEKALADNAKLIADTTKLLGTDAPKAVYDVFLKLVPLHLAIAPPKKKKKTDIDKKYTECCGCDAVEDPDYCCGPNLGPWTLRERLIGPQPYLIEPHLYRQLICCVLEKRYSGAKQAVEEADGEYQMKDAEIKRRRAQVDNGLKSFEKDVKGGLPTTIDCCGDQLPSTEPKPQQAT